MLRKAWVMAGSNDGRATMSNEQRAEAAHAVQESGVPVPPTVLKYPAAHADTRLSLAEAQVYVAPVAALSTVGQVVHAPESR